MDSKHPQVRNTETPAQRDKQTTQVNTPVTPPHTVMYGTPTSAPQWLKLKHASYSPFLTTDSQPVQNVEPLPPPILSNRRYSSP